MWSKKMFEVNHDMVSIVPACRWHNCGEQLIFWVIKRNSMKIASINVTVRAPLFCRRLASIKRTHNGQIKGTEIVWHIETNWYLVCMWDDILRYLFKKNHFRFYCCVDLFCSTPESGRRVVYFFSTFGIKSDLP